VPPKTIGLAQAMKWLARTLAEGSQAAATRVEWHSALAAPVAPQPGEGARARGKHLAQGVVRRQRFCVIVQNPRVRRSVLRWRTHVPRDVGRGCARFGRAAAGPARAGAEDLRDKRRLLRRLEPTKLQAEHAAAQDSARGAVASMGAKSAYVGWDGHGKMGQRLTHEPHSERAAPSLKSSQKSLPPPSNLKQAAPEVTRQTLISSAVRLPGTGSAASPCKQK
jgi:hypothetical protein